jgi:hypothetical protein
MKFDPAFAQWIAAKRAEVAILGLTSGKLFAEVATNYRKSIDQTVAQLTKARP